MKQVTMYEADDGTVFDNEPTCRAYEARNEAEDLFIDWYDSTDGMYSTTTSGLIEADQMVTWLRDNAFHVAELLGLSSK